MRAIKINAASGTVEEITLDTTDTLSGMQAAVGGNIERAAELPNGDDLFVNEEGMINGTQAFIHLRGWTPTPLAGDAIITGHDGHGETVDAKTTLADVRRRLSVLDRTTLAGMLINR